MRTRSQRSQRSDGSSALSPMPPVALSSLPEDALYHVLKFVDENDDARCRAISRSWARLRRVWVLPYPRKEGAGHDPEVLAVVFSPDGSLLAVGAKEHPPVKLYDVATGDLRRALSRGDEIDKNWNGDHEHYKYYPSSLAFTPDGTVIAAGSGGKICIYNVATGESSELWRSTDQYNSSSDVRSVAFSPDGSTLAFCRDDVAAIIGVGGWVKAPSILAVWRGLHVESVENMQRRIVDIAFSPTGSVLAVGFYFPGTVKCFDVATGQTLTEIEFGATIYSVAFSSRGTVAVGGGNEVMFYDGSTGRLQHELRPDWLDGSPSNIYVSTLCFSPDGSTVALNGGRRDAYIYDTETGDSRGVLIRPTQNIMAAAFSPDGKSIALGESLYLSFRHHSRAALYDVATLNLRRMRRPPPRA